MTAIERQAQPGLEQQLERETEFTSPFPIAVYRPNEQNPLTNDELAEAFAQNPNTGEKALTAGGILKKTGVEKRFVATESAEEMALKAVEALKSGAQSLGRVDYVIVSASYPTGQNIAQLINQTYGFGADDTLDIHAACSGFTAGLNFLSGIEWQVRDANILFVTTERYQNTVFDLRDPQARLQDPSLAQTLFSDGATATLFKFGKDLVPLAHTFRGPDDFPAEVSNSIRMPIDYKKIEQLALDFDIPPSPSGKFEQDGKTVYLAIRDSVPAVINQAVALNEEAKLTPGDIKLVIPHQGSKPVVDVLTEQLRKQGYGNVMHDYQEGNWSSGSIPKALDRALREGTLKKGDLAVLAGFGAGLYIHTAVVRI